MATSERKKAEARNLARVEGPVRASLRNLHMSARKIRVVADEIRNKKLSFALEFLSTQKKACCLPLRKLLESAAANASTRSIEIDDLSIKSIVVDKGRLMKRFMPRAQGRATKIRKQTAHIEVVLAE